MPSQHEHRLVKNLDWLSSRKDSVIAMALSTQLAAMEWAKLELPRQRLLDEFVDLLADEVAAISDPRARGYDAKSIARIASVIGRHVFSDANLVPLTKRRPTGSLKEHIEREARSVDNASRLEGTGPTAQAIATWARSSADHLSNNISFASWQLLLLYYANFLISLKSRTATSSSSNTTITTRLELCLGLMRQLHTESDTSGPTDEEIEADLVYENQMLGGFIYALGHASSKAGTTVPVNMFQQTPNDGVFGDLVAGDARCFALEFKRDAKSIQSETGKWTSEALTSLINQSDLISQSLKCHLICYGKREGQTVSLASMLYAKAIGAAEEVVELSADEIISCILEQSIQGQIPPNQAMGVSADQLEDYLRRLAHVRDGSKGGGRAAWLALAAAPDGVHFRLASSLPALVKLLTEPGLRRAVDLPQP